MMPNELAAIAKVPSGAMIMVVTIYAEVMMVCCMPIGSPMCRARFTTSHVGRKRPLSIFSDSSLLRKQSIYIVIDAATNSADAVPMAAPTTPSPAPGIVMCMPSTSTVRVWNIRKKLNTTSSDIITTLIMLGTTMLPELRSIPLPNIENWNMGRAVATMAKYADDVALMLSLPPSHIGRNGLMASDMSPSSALTTNTDMMPWRSVERAFAASFAPSWWLTCT